jgi:hypothetical protein
MAKAGKTAGTGRSGPGLWASISTIILRVRPAGAELARRVAESHSRGQAGDGKANRGGFAGLRDTRRFGRKAGRDRQV